MTKTIPDLRKEQKIDRAKERQHKKRIAFHKRAVVRLKKRIARRAERIRKAEARKDRPAIAAKFLIDHYGWHEDAGRPNRAAWLDRWAREVGDWMVGQPWCGLAVWKAAQAAGVTLDKRTVSTVYIKAAAQSGTGGFKAWHPASATPLIGWVAIYGTSGPVHTGMYVGNGVVAEGNTSPGTGGSQNDGGGLYPRSLASRRGWLLGWAEIDWKQ